MGFTIGGSGASRRRPVHPHIRGVYTPLTCEAGPPIGPSPHTWGLQGAGCKVKEPSRSIPTYVGFTGRRSPGGSPSSVHPHIRGVYDLIYQLLHVLQRSIPTYVGFTAGEVVTDIYFDGPSPHTWGLRSHQAFFSYFFPVHPHIRGVYGSYQHIQPAQVRSIPTYVGFSSAMASKSGRVTVHPHIRGVFGQQVGNRVFVARSIPTYVGFSKFQSGACWYMPVHPHIRGVFAVCFMPQRSEGGPSPHTWGFLPSLHPSKTVTRSIPTYVGFSFRYSRNGE